MKNQRVLVEDLFDSPKISLAKSISTGDLKRFMKIKQIFFQILCKETYLDENTLKLIVVKQS